jgi:transposase
MDTVTEFSEVKVARRYRRRTVDEKRQIVEETLSSGRSVAEIARSHELNVSDPLSTSTQQHSERGA